MCAGASISEEFSEAEARLTNIDDVDKLSSRLRRRHLDLLLQNNLRKSEYLASQQKFRQALECLEAARSTFDAASPALIDQRTTRYIMFHLSMIMGRSKQRAPSFSAP